jgi:SAM-dependent methyltransferase
MWMEHAREGRVEGESEGELHLVRFEDGETVRARPSRPMRERGVDVSAGDAVLVRPRDDGFEIRMRRRFEAGRAVPLLIPAVDPTVEYLLDHGEPKWLHPYLPFLYDWYDPWDRDLPVWRRLAEEAGGPILELACGTGRVAGDLARAGHRVTGLDISRPMIDRAVEKLADEPEDVRARLDWVCADMVAWDGDREFALAFIACNGLHYMGSTEDRPTDDLRRRSIETLFRHVAPGGRGVISNIAPLEPDPSTERHPAPFLPLGQVGVNPSA